MHHNFDVGIAQQYSVEVAIFLENIAFWTQKNISNEKHFYEKHFWTYNSYKAFTDIFSYWSIQTIRRIINACIEHGLIIKGNFNLKRYDNTNWYALTEKGLSLYPLLLTQFNTALLESTELYEDYTPLLESTSHLLESTSPLVGINRPIPDTLQILITDVCGSDQKMHTHTIDNQTTRSKALADETCLQQFNKRFSQKETTIEQMYDLAVAKVGKGKDIVTAIFLDFIITQFVDRYPDKPIEKIPTSEHEIHKPFTNDEMKIMEDYRHARSFKNDRMLKSFFDNEEKLENAIRLVTAYDDWMKSCNLNPSKTSQS